MKVFGNTWENWKDLVPKKLPELLVEYKVVDVVDCCNKCGDTFTPHLQGKEKPYNLYYCESCGNMTYDPPMRKHWRRRTFAEIEKFKKDNPTLINHENNTDNPNITW